MNFLDGVSTPKISVDAFVMEKIKAYAKYAEKRMIILCDIAELEDGSLYVADAFLPKQTVDYVKNKALYEEISPHIKEKQDKYYGQLRCSMLIRTDLSTYNSEFLEVDYKYFESLTDLSDWMIIGEVTKDGKMVLYYLDLEHRLAFTYIQDGVATHTAIKKVDEHYKIELCGYTSEDDVKKEIKVSCVEKKYGGYTDYSKNTSYTTPSAPATVHPKSELNKEDPDISTLV